MQFKVIGQFIEGYVVLLRGAIRGGVGVVGGRRGGTVGTLIVSLVRVQRFYVVSQRSLVDGQVVAFRRSAHVSDKSHTHREYLSIGEL